MPICLNVINIGSTDEEKDSLIFFLVFLLFQNVQFTVKMEYATKPVACPYLAMMAISERFVTKVSICEAYKKVFSNFNVYMRQFSFRHFGNNQ